MAANGHHHSTGSPDGFKHPEGTKGKTMRAVLFHSENKTVSVTDVPFPKLEEPEDAIVRITSSTICGSDLHFLHGTLDLPSEHQHRGIGHEAIGIVEKVGGAVDYLKPGDRVVVLAFSEDGRVNPKQTLIPLLEDEGRTGFGITVQDGLQGEHYPFAQWAAFSH